jgi:hypothetical protein
MYGGNYLGVRVQDANKRTTSQKYNYKICHHIIKKGVRTVPAFHLIKFTEKVVYFYISTKGQSQNH